MKKLIIFMALAVAINTFSFSQTPDSTTNNTDEFMTIIGDVSFVTVTYVHVTESNGEYKMLKFKNKNSIKLVGMQYFGDTSAVLGVMKSYYRQGWKLQSSNMSGEKYVYFLLSRKKIFQKEQNAGANLY
jgi:hypothetical protein